MKGLCILGLQQMEVRILDLSRVYLCMVLEIFSCGKRLKNSIWNSKIGWDFDVTME